MTRRSAWSCMTNTARARLQSVLAQERFLLTDPEARVRIGGREPGRVIGRARTTGNLSLRHDREPCHEAQHRDEPRRTTPRRDADGTTLTPSRHRHGRFLFRRGPTTRSTSCPRLQVANEPPIDRHEQLGLPQTWVVRGRTPPAHDLALTGHCHSGGESPSQTVDVSVATIFARAEARLTAARRIELPRARRPRSRPASRGFATRPI